MCDYSLQNVKSRPATVEDKLVVHNFGTGTKGFADPTADMTAGCATAICVLPGTEIAFEDEIRTYSSVLGFVGGADLGSNVAIFRQVNKDQERVHHDALELPDGKTVLLTHLQEGQRARVLSLPAAPKTAEEAKEQTRGEYAG